MNSSDATMTSASYTVAALAQVHRPFSVYCHSLVGIEKLNAPASFVKPVKYFLLNAPKSNKATRLSKVEHVIQVESSKPSNYTPTQILDGGSTLNTLLVSLNLPLTTLNSPLNNGCDASPKDSYIQLSLDVTTMPGSLRSRSSAMPTSALLHELTPSAMT